MPSALSRTVRAEAVTTDTHTEHHDMTPFLDPNGTVTHDRPAILRRRAEAHRLALQAEPRLPRRRFGLTGRRAGDER